MKIIMEEYETFLEPISPGMAQGSAGLPEKQILGLSLNLHVWVAEGRVEESGHHSSLTELCTLG